MSVDLNVEYRSHADKTMNGEFNFFVFAFSRKFLLLLIRSRQNVTNKTTW